MLLNFLKCSSSYISELFNLNFYALHFSWGSKITHSRSDFNITLPSSFHLILSLFVPLFPLSILCMRMRISPRTETTKTQKCQQNERVNLMC
jgi:hypothetical protein